LTSQAPSEPRAPPCCHHRRKIVRLTRIPFTISRHRRITRPRVWKLRVLTKMATRISVGKEVIGASALVSVMACGDIFLNVSRKSSFPFALGDPAVSSPTRPAGTCVLPVFPCRYIRACRCIFDAFAPSRRFKNFWRWD